MAQTVKHLPTMQETWVQSLGREDLLEKDMATHSSILAWRIPWTEEPGGLQFMGLQRVGLSYLTFFLSESNKVRAGSQIWNNQNPRVSYFQEVLTRSKNICFHY